MMTQIPHTQPTRRSLRTVSKLVESFVEMWRKTLQDWHENRQACCFVYRPVGSCGAGAATSVDCCSGGGSVDVVSTAGEASGGAVGVAGAVGVGDVELADVGRDGGSVQLTDAGVSGSADRNIRRSSRVVSSWALRGGEALLSAEDVDAALLEPREATAPDSSGAPDSPAAVESTGLLSRHRAPGQWRSLRTVSKLALIVLLVGFCGPAVGRTRPGLRSYLENRFVTRLQDSLEWNRAHWQRNPIRRRTVNTRGWNEAHERQTHSEQRNPKRRRSEAPDGADGSERAKKRQKSGDRIEV